MNAKELGLKIVLAVIGLAVGKALAMALRGAGVNLA